MSYQPAGKLLLNESLARYTSWRVGGPADRYYCPADKDDLSAFLQNLDANEPVYWLGAGSNVLVRDGGIRGTVIHLRRCLSDIRIESDGSVYVEAGVACAQVAKFCEKNQLAGAGFLIGIPGTMGGALAMNAGAFGGETWSLVKEAELIDRQGNQEWVKRLAVSIGYRSVSIPDNHWFIAARLELQQATASDESVMKELLERRRKTQPVTVPTCGSVFKNPQGDFAARLIQACGLKGHRVGGAQVSTKHANFIENVDAASAHDLELLIHVVVDRVEREQGVRLETEVRFVGESLE